MDDDRFQTSRRVEGAASRLSLADGPEALEAIVNDLLQIARDIRNGDYDGMRAARAYATWRLGDSSWADNIVHAYMNPAETVERLEREQAKYDTKAAES